MIVFFYMVWLAPRLVAVADNTLFYDDYFMGVPGGPVPAGPWAHVLTYRPTLYVSHVFWEWVLGPGFFLSVFPKLIAGLYLGVALLLLYRFLRSLELSPVTSLTPCLLFATHVTVSEITLWNTIHGLPLGYALVIGGFVMLSRDLRWRNLTAGIVLVLAGTLTYQPLLFVLPVMLAIHLLAAFLTSGRLTISHLRLVLVTVAVFLLVGGVYMLYMEASRFLSTDMNPRGMREVNGIRDLLGNGAKAAVNLYVNAWMPVLTWYVGIHRAWAIWEYVPLLFAALTLLAGWCRKIGLISAVLVGVCTLLIPLIPLAIVFLAGSSPESWRVATPVVFAACLGLVPLFGLLNGDFASGSRAESPETRQAMSDAVPPRGLGGSILGLILLGLLWGPTWYESSLRVSSADNEQHLLDDLKRFWGRNDRTPDEIRFSIARRPPAAEDPRQLANAKLSVAYNPLTRYSPLDSDFSAPGFLIANGFANAAELDFGVEGQLAEACTRNPSKRYPEAGWQVLHLLDDRRTVLCGY